MDTKAKGAIMTASTGMPLDTDQDTLTAGVYGPIVLEDFHFVDKISHFDRERIPERVVHAKGSGAHGFFKAGADVSMYTKAKVFDTIGKVTPIFTRFSTVAGERGAADTQRDPRGFSIKFYTEEGNWDMVGNNTPVFFVRDPIKFPDFIHTQKRDPVTNCHNKTAIWDFWGLTPESTHQVTILMSERGIPDGFRHMHGYSSHTFRWVNKDNESHWVKLHFRTKQGIKNLAPEKADMLKGSDPDYATRDLYQAMKAGNAAEWSLYIQAIPEKDAIGYRFNIFDVTKTVSQKDYPLIYVGDMVLNRNPENYFAETEQAAFSPGHLVPGMEVSPDKMLQGRLFSYPDTHRHRLGTNYNQIPINCPYRSHVNNGQRDGPMAVQGNQGSRPNYHPNSFQTYKFDENAKYSPYRITGLVARHKPNHPNCDFEQPGILFRKVLNEDQRQQLVKAAADHMKDVPRDIQERAIKNFYKCDPEYGDGICKHLGYPSIKSKL